MGHNKHLKIASYLIGTYLVLAVILINVIQLLPNAVQAAEKKVSIGSSIQSSTDRIELIKPQLNELIYVEIAEPVIFKSQEPIIAVVPEIIEAAPIDNAITVNAAPTVAIVPLTPEQTVKNAELQSKIDKVKTYLTNYGAPVAEKAEYFVLTAEKFSIDYRLVAAISIIESGGGKKCSRPFNAWGWGGVNGITFSSWEHGIDTVTQTLKEKYYDRGAKTPDQISKYYNPESAVQWAGKVNWVMAQM